MRRYITLLQTLSRRRVITRGFLNQMCLSQRHEHPSSRRDGANAIKIYLKEVETILIAIWFFSDDILFELLIVNFLHYSLSL